MGLLGKTNRRATRRSVIRWACWGAFFGCAFALFMLWQVNPPLAWRIYVPLMTIGGAFSGALIEWQGC